MANYSLILASSSRYRRELLDRLGLDYVCVSPDVDESVLPEETPLDVCQRLARAKALAVAQAHPGSVVIGSDQVCDLDGVALGKPHTFEKAVEQLERMQSRRLVFHTAVCVVRADGTLEETVSDTIITMRPLSRETIEDYVRREEPYDCAGSAKIEKLGIALMQSVASDDPTSLIGLPLMRLTSMLANAGIPALAGLKG
ncbi:MAG: septum formation protein Maf [Duodenibacillus sp.]|nr:septum formation protein Maf [Duodenibacillus sp.]